MPGDAQGRDLRAHLLLMPRDGTREPTFCCRALRAGLGESGGPLQVCVPGLRHPLGRVSFTRGCPFQEKAFIAQYFIDYSYKEYYSCCLSCLWGGG